MLSFLTRPLMVALPTLFLVVTLAFFMMRAEPPQIHFAFGLKNH